VASGEGRAHGEAVTTILITGASRGIGAHTAHHLAAGGATVYAGARRPEHVQTEDGADLRPITLDVTDDASVAAAVQRVQEEAGALDVLVNNAGVPGSWAGPADIGPADFHDVFEVNVFAPARLTRAFLPLLLRGQHPRLVMVSSGMGSLTLQSSDATYADIAHLPYPASKAALNMLVVQYAKALPEVLVTAVDPGLTATDFTSGSGHSVAEGAEAVITAALDATGPSGRFMDRHGPTPW